MQISQMLDMAFYIILLMCCSSVFHVTATCISIPDLPTDVYEKQGDINIGAIIPVHKYTSNGFCSFKYRELGALQRVLAVVHTTDEINNRTDILPGINLGYVIYDDCSKDTTGLAQVTHFIQNESDNSSCPATTPNSVIRNVQNYNVVGVIGTESSSNTMVLARLLGLFHIPQVSYISTNAALSDKHKYPYFSRIVPPDNFQAKVMVDLLLHYGWSYVSVLYTEGSYGEGGYKAVKSAAEAASSPICFAVIREVKLSFGDTETEGIIDDLLTVPKAKAVILFGNLATATKVFSAALRKGVTSNFTWIGSDAWGRNIQDYKGLEEVARGALTIKMFSDNVPTFNSYFGNLNPSLMTSNPWFNSFWESELNCTINTTDDSRRCASGLSFSNDSNWKPETTVSLVRDATYSFAWAIHNLIQSNCPGSIGADARNCINGQLLLEHIKKVNFSGTLGGQIFFDSNQDGNTDYEIQNLYKDVDGIYKVRRVGLWETGRQELVINDSLIFFNPNIVDLTTNKPKSLCSDECEVHYEQKTRLNDPPCCWTCQKCRNNEITYQAADDYIKCQACDPKHKPESTNYSYCITIVPEYMDWSNPVGIAVCTVTSILFVLALVVTGLFIKHRDEKLIKACSRELSYYMMVGCLLSYLLPFVFLAKPQTEICITIYAGFHLTCTIMYGPLVVKTNRIYRIFESGKKTTKRPSMIDTKSQILFASVIIIVHAIVIVIWGAVVVDPWVLEEETFPKVEVICKISQGAFITSLSLNILLVFVSVFYAFKTRKLPDNFNESKFITFSVYTTFVMWLAFVPAYFIAKQTIYATSVLCCGMIVNATVTIGCLYCPKIYAIYYVKKEDMAIHTVSIQNSMLKKAPPTVSQRVSLSSTASNITLSATENNSMQN